MLKMFCQLCHAFQTNVKLGPGYCLWAVCSIFRWTKNWDPALTIGLLTKFHLPFLVHWGPQIPVWDHSVWLAFEWGEQLFFRTLLPLCFVRNAKGVPALVLLRCDADTFLCTVHERVTGCMTDLLDLKTDSLLLSWVRKIKAEITWRFNLRML